MSIKKRLLLSNLGMIVIPMIGFLLLEMILGYFLFNGLNGEPREEDLRLFSSIRLIGMAFILVGTNGLLTYVVSKSIIKPIAQLRDGLKEISEGHLDFNIDINNKDEIGQLSKAFDDMRLRLKQAKAEQLRYEKNRKELIASISHDLRTPLTSIKGYINGIQDGVANTPEKTDRYLSTIYKKTCEMDQLIDELFLYSKLDLERIPFRFEAVDLYSFFSDIVEELTFTFGDSQGKMTLKADPNHNWMVRADREQLKRVADNIIANSLKYMEKDEKDIKVYFTTESDHIIVEIRDNGRGIAKEDLPFIFEGFFRTDTSRNSSTGGSGLGLAIVKKIIEGHGGEVWAKSELGLGTSIYFTLKKVTM